jgi:hypothetical protein
MLSGRYAVTVQLGSSTTSLIFRSTAAEQRIYASPRVRSRWWWWSIMRRERVVFVVRCGRDAGDARKHVKWNLDPVHEVGDAVLQVPDVVDVPVAVAQLVVDRVCVRRHTVGAPCHTGMKLQTVASNPRR